MNGVGARDGETARQGESADLEIPEGEINQAR